MQRTNVVLDEKLVREGMKLFKKKTKKELIDFALREIIRREKAKGILALEGKVNWEGDQANPQRPMSPIAGVPDLSYCGQRERSFRDSIFAFHSCNFLRNASSSGLDGRAAMWADRSRFRSSQ